ncbi:MAG: hypothetical protein ACOX20_11955 [Limnochordia bacterium]
MVSDQPLKFLLGEYIREKVLELTREEVPHAVAVEVEEVSPSGRSGADGCPGHYLRGEGLPKRDSSSARGGGCFGASASWLGCEMEGLLDRQVNLQLWVKVKKDWREQESALRSLGYS